ncbi:hypothetical protein MKX08_001360 [Trichoderma sp. CBMAI-0020]|nr:hypothetical protein MKX08_001360 [Trichoderma sp. CBMAI-0020]
MTGNSDDIQHFIEDMRVLLATNCLFKIVLEEVLYIPRRQETDREEWGSQDTTLCGDEMDDEQIDHGADTEPLLREWLAEQRLLNQMDADDTDDETEFTSSTSSTVDFEMDVWFSHGGSRDDGDGSSLVAVADPFLLPESISD